MLRKNYSGRYEWELPGFAGLAEKQASPCFGIGPYSWRLICFPKQNNPPNRFLSVFLEYPEAHATPPDLSPAAKLNIIIINHKDPTKHFAKDANHTFTPDQVDWGFSQLLPLTDVSVGSGYLREDGALVIRAELKVIGQRHMPPQSNVAVDLLSLLDQPGATSDITITAGDRSFRAHRAILDARCEYFRTLFASGFPDGAAQSHNLLEADPEAFQILLRFIYGGVLDEQPRAVLKPAAELADRLRLTDAYSELCARIQVSCSPQTVVSDLIWAAQRGEEDVLGRLEDFYLENAGKVSADEVAHLAEANPQLMAKLHVALAARTAG